MTTIIITLLILIILALTIKVIGQSIRINGYEDEENSREIEEMHCECDSTNCMVHHRVYRDDSWQRQAEFIAKHMPEGFDINAEVFKNGKIGELEIHPCTDGDPCRCEECVERFTKELKEDLK